MRFERQKGQRLHRYFVWYDVDGHWWIPEVRKWVSSDEREIYYPKHTAASTVDCKTLRAFRRALRKYPHIRGKATLVNRYKHFDVYA